MAGAKVDEGHSGKTAAIGTLVVVYPVFDAYAIGVPVVVLSAWLNPLVVFAVAAVAVALINVALCGWLDGHWDGWVASGRAAKVEKRLEKLRSGKVMRHPVEWITRGSDAWFALAAALINAITVVAIARLVGGQAVGRHRILVASIAYALFFVALFSIIGFALGDVIRAA
jgi:ABC-type multidrug transport system fused ATPase/permease subunit